MTRPNNITQTMTQIGELPEKEIWTSSGNDWVFHKTTLHTDDLKQLVAYIEGLEAYKAQHEGKYQWTMSDKDPW